MVSKFKYGENSVMSTLLDHNTYTKYDKFNIHRVYSVGWLKYVNPIISLQRTTREKIWYTHDSTSKWKGNGSNDNQAKRQYRRSSQEEPTSHSILRYPSQNGRKWERFKPNIDHSLRHQMQSQKILFTPNPSSKIFWRSQQQLHLHPIRTTVNDKRRNI